jgi:hypothetical protein
MSDSEYFETSSETSEISETSEPFKICNCDCGKKFNHKSSLSRHRSTCKYVKQQEQMDMMMKMMMMQMNMNMTKQAPQEQKKEKPEFSVKKYLASCNNVPDWKEFMRSKKFTIDEYDTMYNNGSIEGMKKIINTWLETIDKKMLPFVITNNEKRRFTIYCRENGEWKKYEEENGYNKILNFIESVSCRMLFNENMNVIYSKYPYADISYNRSYKQTARDQQQIKIVMLGVIANVAEHLREISKGIISNFVIKKDDDDDDE